MFDEHEMSLQTVTVQKIPHSYITLVWELKQLVSVVVGNNKVKITCHAVYDGEWLKHGLLTRHLFSSV